MYVVRISKVIFICLLKSLRVYLSSHTFLYVLGDLKESSSLGESSHVMFSRMTKYSSLTAFYTFSEQRYRGQSLFASVLKIMYRAVKSTTICSVSRIFKTKCKLFMCAKGKHKTKRNNSPC